MAHGVCMCPVGGVHREQSAATNYTSDLVCASTGKSSPHTCQVIHRHFRHFTASAERVLLAWKYSAWFVS